MDVYARCAENNAAPGHRDVGMLAVLIGGADREDPRIHGRELNAQCGWTVTDTRDDDDVGIKCRLHRGAESSRRPTG
jgi:hypothetical protein